MSTGRCVCIELLTVCLDSDPTMAHSSSVMAPWPLLRHRNFISEAFAALSRLSTIVACMNPDSCIVAFICANVVWQSV